MSDIKEILSGGGSGKNLPEDRLMAYLEGRLSPAEQHEVELWLTDEGMEADALEGLRSLPADDAKHSADLLNHRLRKTLHAKKRRRRKPDNNQFTYIAIVIILMLIVVAYIVMRKSM